MKKEEIYVLVIAIFIVVFISASFTFQCLAKSPEEPYDIVPIDAYAPMIELSGPKVLYLDVNTNYVEPGYSAIDNEDGLLTEYVVVKNNVDTTKVGEYDVVYTVSDSFGNASEARRKVNVVANNVKSVPVLTYHTFMTKTEKNKYWKSDKYTMDIDVFEEQLKYLKEHGYNSITLEDLYKWYNNEKVLTNKDFVLTIDDGNISSYVYAMPIIEKYGFNATVFVITSRITSGKLKWDPSKLQFFSNEIIDDINKNHKSIYLAAHTHYLHSTIDGSCAMAFKTEDEIYNDVLMSKNIINSEYLAYPYGCYTENTLNAMGRAGYKMAFSFNTNKRATKADNVYAVDRLNVNSEVSMKKFMSWMEG